ncbi:hypothetical protein AJ80_01518 [Polytolypa hystricis UAMH7299]|uniref:Protein S-acyltransferase n=1 Tax=Polytolypa hystricis (strain UAMH7299) TaxID=1447883 RepID=A0A2B7YRV5_POLH7|nr:hypothetical protein AJ80_01518 [Polytolypa hystricis UAMH7299]
MRSFQISQLAVPAVTALIVFLAYSSQYLFLHIEPHPLSKEETVKFNILLACLWVCFFRSWAVDAGRIPSDWQPSIDAEELATIQSKEGLQNVTSRQRWCRRCEAYKPPRTHHCKADSEDVFPIVSMIYLEYFLYIRAVIVWQSRHMPSYLGPSLLQLSHLFLLVVLNSTVLFVLVVLLVSNLWSLMGNVTTVETWEIERHEALVRRACVFGGYLDGPDGIKIRIQKQEFPYDIGIWANIKAGMGGSANLLSWFWPFAASPQPGTGLEFEVNGFEDPELSWPPPDPDRMIRQPPQSGNENGFTYGRRSQAEEIESFKCRQQEDALRRRPDALVHRRRPFHERYVQNIEIGDLTDYSGSERGGGSDSGEEGWRTAEGERLRDFGIDEEAEFYDEDNIPLAELLRMRKDRVNT